MAKHSQVVGTAPGKNVGRSGVGSRILRVLSHPVRIDILRVLSNRVASPKELADELGEDIGNVSYHFKYLRHQDCIEILDTEPRRGAIEHYHRATAPQPHDGTRDFVAEVIRALNAGGFDARADRVSWMPMELDEQGRRELAERQAGWIEELKRIEVDAAKRLAEGSPARRVVAGTIGFETPPGTGFTAPAQNAGAATG